MALVTGAEVKEILETSLSAAELAPFITAAHEVIDHYLGNEDLTAALLKEIERWFAAHLATARDPLASREKIGDAEVTYQGKFGLGLDGTSYGQMVKSLDITGILSEIGKKKVEFISIDLGLD